MVQKFLRGSHAVRFSGDNYSHDWIEEATRRGLPNIEKSVEAFTALTSASTARTFKEVLSETELSSRYEVELEAYCNQINIQANLLAEMFRTQMLPAAIEYQDKLASSQVALRHALGQHDGSRHQAALLDQVAHLIEAGIEAVGQLEQTCASALKLSLEHRARSFCYEVVDQCLHLRTIADKLESLVDDALWPLPKYRELLFMV